MIFVPVKLLLVFLARLHHRSSSSHQSSSSSFSSSPLPCSTALHPPLIFPAPPLVHCKKALLSSFSISIMASKKIADAKLAKDFQAVLKEFPKAQRLAAERETTYTPFVPQAVLPSSYAAQELDISSDKSTEQRALLVELLKLLTVHEFYEIDLGSILNLLF
ncbi:hypothetical protein ACOSP7_022006 [Xanthoceras sorbifolium]